MRGSTVPTASETEPLRALLRQKRFAEAEPLLGNAVAIRARDYGRDDLRLAKLLSDYAILLRLNENYSEAAKIDVRAASMRVGSALTGGFR